MKKVIIIGGGFGGIKTALGLAKANVDLLVIDKTNHHLFQPLLYQVATAAISENSITSPIREILRRQSNTTVIMDEVVSVDKHNKQVHLLDGRVCEYDYLVVATGAISSYFGNDNWKTFLHGLKTVHDAVIIREHILMAYELAERCTDKLQAEKYLQFVIIGGGPTGVELAGAIAEIANTSIFENFKNINPKNTKIYLIEGAENILQSYPLHLRIRAQKDLESMGVDVLTNTKVTDISTDGVSIGDRFIETPNVIWAAGNAASPLLKTLGVPLDKDGRAYVDPDLSIPGYPELFVIGDAAAVKDKESQYLPALAAVAMQQGKFVAKIISEEKEKSQRKPFAYYDKGSMATIGKDKAVAMIGGYTFSGLFAWLVWCFIHILYLINFRNRFIVMSEWFFLYFTDRRNACTIIHSIDEIDQQQKNG